MRPSVTREAEGGAEGRPVGGFVDIGILDHDDRLIEAGDPGFECGVEIIDRREVGRHDRVARAAIALAVDRIAAVRAEGVVLPHPQFRARPEIAERNDAVDRGGERGRYLGIARIRDVMDTVHVGIVDLGMECLANVAGRARERDHHPARQHAFDVEPCADSHLVMVARSCSATPNLVPNSPAVSHL